MHTHTREKRIIVTLWNSALHSALALFTYGTTVHVKTSDTPPWISNEHNPSGTDHGSCDVSRVAGRAVAVAPG